MDAETKHHVTAESADRRPKPGGNDGDCRGEDRSPGYLAWPVSRRDANLNLPTQSPAVWHWRLHPSLQAKVDVK